MRNGTELSRSNRRRGLLRSLGTASVFLLAGASGSAGQDAEGLRQVVVEALVHGAQSVPVTLLATNAEGVRQELPVVSDVYYEVFLFEPGPWLVGPAPGSGFWGRQVVIETAEGPAAPEDAGEGADEAAEIVPVFEAPMYRSVTATGRLLGPDPLAGELQILLGDAAPDEVDARFSVQGVTIECPVADDGSWSCEVPSTVVHLVFWRPGYAPEYRWDTALSGRRRIELGRQVLRPGSSLAGFVTAGEDFRGLVQDCLIGVLKTDPLRRGRAESVSEPVEEVPVAGDGFFQAVDVGAGRRWLEARCEGRIAARAGPYEVEEGRENFLRQRIALEGSHLLGVFVEPPDPPYDSHWVARLRPTKERDEAGFRRPYRQRRQAVQTAVVEAGRAVFHVPGNGAFVVDIEDANGGRYGSSDYLEVLSDRSVTVDLEMTPVVGRLSLGSEPLAGMLFFGGRDGPPDLIFESGDDGWFRGAVPGPSGWRVDVAAPDREVLRSFHDVDVPVGRPLELRLGRAVVTGRITVAATGAPAAGALVRLRYREGAGGVQMVSAGPAGEYMMRGVPDGPVTIQATHNRGAYRQSPVYETVITSGGTIVFDLVVQTPPGYPQPPDARDPRQQRP